MTTKAQINDTSFARAILDQPGLTAAKFTAEWCAPCHVLAPIFDAVATAHADKAQFVEVDADASPQASVRFGVRGLPTILFFSNGEVVSRLVGSVPRAHIEKELERLSDSVPASPPR
jgi:thioredoxin 1